MKKNKLEEIENKNLNISFRRLIRDYKTSKYHKEKEMENIILKINGKNYTQLQLKKIEEKNQKIYDYYKHKEFLKDNGNDNYTYLFITFTIDPKYNNLKNISEVELIENIKAQQQENLKHNRKLNNSLYNNNVDYDYISVKEFTKSNNIHIHSMYKVNIKDLNNFIKCINNIQKKGFYSRIEIVMNKIKLNLKDTKLKTKLIKEKEENKYILSDKRLKDNEIIDNYLSGKYVYIKNKKGNNILGYLLKYMNKEHKTLEHIVLNEIGLKKVSYKSNKSVKIRNQNNYESEKLEQKKLIRIISRLHNILKSNNKKDIEKELIKVLKLNYDNLYSKILKLIKMELIIKFNGGIYYIDNNGFYYPIIENKGLEDEIKLDMKDKEDRIIKEFIKLENYYITNDEKEDILLKIFDIVWDTNIRYEKIEEEEHKIINYEELEHYTLEEEKEINQLF